MWWKSEPILLLLWMARLTISQMIEKEKQMEDTIHHLEQIIETPGAFGTVIGSLSNIWNNEVVESAIGLRYTGHLIGRHARDLSSIISPFVSSVSSMFQTVSYLPVVLQVIVGGVAGLVEVFGRGIVILASGMDYGATAIDVIGKSIQTLSTSVPTAVGGMVMTGGALIFLYPGLQDLVFSTIASSVLGLAGKVAARAKTFVEEDSFWGTLLQTLELFTQKARQDI